MGTRVQCARKEFGESAGQWQERQKAGGGSAVEQVLRKQKREVD